MLDKNNLSEATVSHEAKQANIADHPIYFAGLFLRARGCCKHCHRNAALLHSVVLSVV